MFNFEDVSLISYSGLFTQKLWFKAKDVLCKIEEFIASENLSYPAELSAPSSVCLAVGAEESASPNFNDPILAVSLLLLVLKLNGYYLVRGAYDFPAPKTC